MEQPEDQVAIYPSKAKLWGIVAVSAAAVAMGVHILIREHNPTSSYGFTQSMLIPEYIGIPFFVVVLGYAISRLVKWHPSVMVDTNGLTSYSPWHQELHIKWDEMSEAYIVDIIGFRYMAIIPTDPRAIKSRCGVIGHASFVINKTTTGAAIQIGQILLDRNVTGILDIIEQHGVKVRHKGRK